MCLLLTCSHHYCSRLDRPTPLLHLCLDRQPAFLAVSVLFLFKAWALMRGARNIEPYPHTAGSSFPPASLLGLPYRRSPPALGRIPVGAIRGLGHTQAGGCASDHVSDGRGSPRVHACLFTSQSNNITETEYLAFSLFSAPGAWAVP